jgi:DNA-binding Lrp family transcriptional regulator
MEIDLIPISQLPSRYGIARSNLYNRLKDLQIEPIKQGKKAFVNASQLQLLDQLHVHLQQGGITSEFIKQQELVTSPTGTIETTTLSRVQHSSEPMVVIQPTALVGVLEAVIKRLLPSSKSRLSYLRELEEAYQNGWLLSTSEIADLLGLSSSTITGYGQEFSDAGFVFTRVGIRKGGEIAWAIDKEEWDWNESEKRSIAQISSKSSIGVKEAFSDAFDP